jgi:hypothetical protein
MEAGKIQRSYVFSITQKVTESEFEGYHGEGLAPALKRGFNRELGLEPATSNLHHTEEDCPRAPFIEGYVDWSVANSSTGLHARKVWNKSSKYKTCAKATAN